MHAEEEGATESRDGGDDGRAHLSEVVVRQTVDHRRVDHRRVDRHILVVGSPLGGDGAVVSRLEGPLAMLPQLVMAYSLSDAYDDVLDKGGLHSLQLYKARRNSNSP